VIKLNLEQLRHCTCKKHYEERCKILYDQGKLICWTTDKHFNQPRNCIVCMDEELKSLRTANKDINEKRLFLLRGLEVTWKLVDALPPEPGIDYKEYKKFKCEFEEKA